MRDLLLLLALVAVWIFIMRVLRGQNAGGG
jgi:hypothetical protein